MTLRPAVPADAEGIAHAHYESVKITAAAHYDANVRENWSRKPDADRYSRLRAEIAAGNSIFLVAEDEKGVAGFGIVVPKGNELRAVYVHPRAGRRGIGSLILEELELRARAAGVKFLELDGSLNAEAFYRKHGYASLRRGVHRLNSGLEMACVKMRKTL